MHAHAHKHQEDRFKNSPSELFVLSYDILSSYAATAKLALKVSDSKSPQEKVAVKCGATTHQVALVMACEPAAITAG